MLATSFSIKLDTSKNSKSKNGDYPVVLQVTHNRKPRRMRLGINATKESWVDGRVSDTLHNHNRINSRLSRLKTKHCLFMKTISNLEIDSISRNLEQNFWKKIKLQTSRRYVMNSYNPKRN